MRRFLKFLAGTAVLFVAAVLLSPYWLGWVLPAIARNLRASSVSYSRVGYSRFVLENVVVERRTVTVRAARAEADTPWLWAARHLLHRDHLILVDDWSVEVHVKHSPSHERDEEGWVELQAHLSRIANGLERWLRFASIGRGFVEWPKNKISLEHAAWHGRKLQVQTLQWRGLQGDVDLLFDANPSRWQVDLQGHNPILTLRAKADRSQLSGSINFQNQNAPFSADFPAEGWMPSQAHIAAENWHFNGEPLRLRGYAAAQGSVEAKWDQQRFKILAHLQSTPNPGTSAPPLNVALQAEGDEVHYEIDQADISIPGVSAHLGRPISGSFELGESAALPPSSQFIFEVQLPQLTMLKAEGVLHGAIDVLPQTKGWPTFRFSSAGENIGVGDFKIAQLAVVGNLAWPQLTIDRADVSTSPTSKLQLSGAADFTTRELKQFHVDGHLDPDLFKPWLPAGVSLSGMRVTADAEGPFDALRHQGDLRLEELRIHRIQPALVQIQWKGRGSAVAEYNLGIQTGNTEIVAAGSATDEQIAFEKLSWRQANLERLTLQNPAVLVWRPQFKVEGLNLIGPAGELRVSAIWGEKGMLSIFARGIDAAWWRDFVPLAPFAWSIQNWYVKANWDRGPAVVDTVGKVVINIPERPPVTVDLAANADGRDVVLQRLQATEANTPLANFSGKFPLQIFVGAETQVKLDRTASIDLHGKLNSAAPEWTELAQRLGLVVEKPDVTIALSGSFEKPKGSLDFSADELQFDERLGGKNWPKIASLHANFLATGDRLELNSGGLKLGGQSIEISGSLPMREGMWVELRKSPLKMLQDHATLKLRIPAADLTDLAPFASPLLLPQGHLDADISLSGSDSWNGYLRFNDLATKSIGSVGRLRDIHGDIELSGRKVSFKDFQLSFGERPIKIGGTLDLPREGAPQIELTAEGEDLPFVRQAGILVRGNVHLKLSSADRKTLRPIIQGDIELTDGLFVSDVRSLIPRGGSSPQLRPPYFAIENEPFKNWRLDVDLHGDRFLRARTTVFTGTTSMRFHLLGTLGEPRALGELRLNDGQVMFPFAQFSLNDATIRLTDGDPYDPALGVFGKSRRYGYDLSMEVTGKASAPVIAFSANPPLTSEQVLLMVMAGEVPKDEIAFSTTQKISRLGTFFGQSLLGTLGGGQGQDRLTITSGQEVSITGRETYEVEYALNDRWSLMGEYDEFDDYNAGVKWKILAKHRPAPDEKK